MLTASLLVLLAVALVLLFVLAALPQRHLLPIARRVTQAFVFCTAMLMTIALGLACSASQIGSDVTAVTDISDAVCTELEANLQPDPAWVQFICSQVPKGGGAPRTFKVKVSKTTAKAFAVDHCPSTGKVSP
jgi:hypothetical protein